MAKIEPIEDLGSFETEKGFIFQGSDLAANISQVVSSVVGFFTVVAGLAFTIYFFLGAINWITSQGDEQKIKKARDTITNALTGIVITAIAYPTVYLITQLLGIPMASPQELINTLVIPNP